MPPLIPGVETPARRIKTQRRAIGTPLAPGYLAGYLAGYLGSVNSV